jgi:hypothetical protein
MVPSERRRRAKRASSSSMPLGCARSSPVG